MKVNQKMHEPIKNIPDANLAQVTPTNIKFTPINIIMPKKLPQRDDNVWLTSPVRFTND